MQSPEHDIALFQRIRADDRVALNALFAQYYQKLCGFAYTYLRNTDEAEEAVSDVFFTLWRHRHQLSIDKNLKAYLYTSVRHAALAVLRARRPALEDADDSGLVETLADTRDPESALAYDELRQHIDAAVDTLPPRCRQIFLMSRMEALTYREISEVLGISEKTVENQLVKALGLLRTAIRQYGLVVIVMSTELAGVFLTL
ncbi:RNA polymerase sigma-70 factor [Dawidia soli]|uniref:RNA polymerase sigma-70 factor n=1 Tax=Dawidia soli TaxID=2782352 RepID=A0AAP2DDN9_9BACT|nr:RNA polymerase sigma-70 factor [Dawidia soli]MBT1689261.1 RNA polymerase sigma-70 factor [Dawidia soli]